MLASHDVFQEMLQDKEVTPVKKERSRALLVERSVNIYSDMGDTVYEGDIITLTGELTGFTCEAVRLQWQYDDGARWMDVPGANGVKHSFIATAESIEYSWRLSVSVDD